MPVSQAPKLEPQGRVAPSWQSQYSSVTPLQLSSTPLQVSVPGLTSPTQSLQWPLTQVLVPATHGPTSVPQRCVAPLTQSQPSSVAPLQLSSTPLQVSVAGPT